MTQDEIIELARQAGFNHGLDDPIIYAAHERFAKLVAEKEREACAKIVEESSLPDTYSQECMPDIANEIRARGQA